MNAQPALEFRPQPGCLLIRVRSREILEQKSATIRLIADTLKADNLRATLLDVREVPGPVTFMDRFQLGVTAGRYLGGVNVGVLARIDQADPQRIGQLVARNRGVEVEVFTDPVPADAWVQRQAAKS